MKKKILIISGSPKKDGNTSALIEWVARGARETSAEIRIVHAASLKFKTLGCTSCRACQKKERYICVVKDDARPVLAAMPEYDVILMATPLYFFSASARLKLIFDRMFSLYKWDNDSGTMTTPLKDKTFALVASAFEDQGLEALSAPFQLTAEYTGMRFMSLVVPNAGVSGDIRRLPGIEAKAVAFGREVGRA